MGKEVDVQKQIDDATKGLKKNRDDLLAEVKDLKAMLNGVDIEALKNDSKELAKLKKKSAKEKGDFEALYSATKEALSKTESEVASLKEQLSSEKVRGKLVTELSSRNIFPELTDTATKLLLNNTTITDDGKLIVGEEPIGKYLDSWSKSDVGKHFFSDGNTGGGAGGEGGSSQKSDADYFNPKSDRFSVTKQAAVARKSPELFSKYKNMYASTETD